MSSESVLAKFATLNVWERAGERKPYKQILALYALGQWNDDKRCPILFEDAEETLADLMTEFGGASNPHPEYPFWYLQNDDVWSVHPSDLTARKGKADQPSAKTLREAHATGEFTADVREALTADPTLVNRIAAGLLASHFPPTYHADIAERVGLDPSLPAPEAGQRRRDPSFRPQVLAAYKWQCVVCGFKLRLQVKPNRWVDAALEAAHIKWHNAGGEDEVRNGLALCSLHHKAFDLGVFTVGKDGRLLVSSSSDGNEVFHQLIGRHHNRQIELATGENAPDPESLDWHFELVFKGEPRPSE
jgi:putative restriction endonuclease